MASDMPGIRSPSHIPRPTHDSAGAALRGAAPGTWQHPCRGVPRPRYVGVHARRAKQRIPSEFDAIAQELNEKQLEAVTSTSDCICVQAGPGR